jgi:uncharacterized membrane protein
LAILLLLKAIQSLTGLLKSLARLLPDWLPGEEILSVLLVLVFCYLVGLAIPTSPGHAIRQRIERSVFEKIPGYALFRSFTQRLAGESEDAAWKPALAEIEDVLLPTFIIEELADGRYTVFVPSVPTPLAGAVYVLSRDRVHPLDIAFTRAKGSQAQLQRARELFLARPARRLEQPDHCRSDDWRNVHW